MLQLIKTTNIDFMGKRKLGYMFSGLLVLLSLIFLVVKGPRLGVDFAGGALVWVRFEQPVEVGQVRLSLDKIGKAKASIQRLSGTNEFVIRADVKEDPGKFADDVLSRLASDFEGNKLELRDKEAVEPKISREMTTRTIWAIVLGMLLMAIYIWFRFDFRFGVCSTLALFHNILITIGALILTGREFTIVVVGALLTILGYAINDTIVVSDRVRENIKKLRGRPMREVINISLNETLSRTVLTGLFVILSLFCLFFFGGPVIADFAFTLIVGLIFGTYSSVFIVCALVVDLEEKLPRKRR